MIGNYPELHFISGPFLIQPIKFGRDPSRVY